MNTVMIAADTCPFEISRGSGPLLHAQGVVPAVRDDPLRDGYRFIDI